MYNEHDADFDYDPNNVLDLDPSLALKTAKTVLNIVSSKDAMSSLETVLRESYKFIRLADDLHDIKWYLNDIRLCFMALTISGYVGLIIYGLILCVTKTRRGRNGGSNGGDVSLSARASLGGGARHRQSCGGQYDEEMNYGGGWKSDDQTIKLNPNRTPNDVQNRYSTRSLNRNLQGNYKMDSVDSPSKKMLLENHNALQGIIVTETSPPNSATRENGGIGHRMQ